MVEFVSVAICARSYRLITVLIYKMHPNAFTYQINDTVVEQISILTTQRQLDNNGVSLLLIYYYLTIHVVSNFHTTMCYYAYYKYE